MRRIEICGGIASGKTTLATQLMKHPETKALFENFEANPFIDAFYESPAEHAFEAEITFLLQHYHQIKVGSTPNKVTICDFSLILDRAYVDVTLSGTSRDAFLAVYDEVTALLPPPTLLIHLHCSAETELERIQRRARSVESSITVDYLGEINRSVALHVSTVFKRSRVFSIKSDEHDFAEDERVQQDIIGLTFETLADVMRQCEHPEPARPKF